MTRYNLGLYWGPRGASSEECARRLQEFLSSIRDLDHVFSQWGEKGASRAKAMEKQVDVGDLSELTRIVEKGTQRRDTDRSRIEHIGFGFGLWNMLQRPETMSLRVLCGISKPIQGIGGNSLVLSFSSDLISRLKVDVVAKVLSVGAKVWKPTWGGVFSSDAMLEQSFDSSNPLIDWLLYVDCGFASVGRIAPPSRVIDVNQTGKIIVTQETPAAKGNSAHDNLVAAIRDSLHIEQPR